MTSQDLVHLVVDTDRCIGVGQCELFEPEVFRLDDDTGISGLLGDGTLPRGRARVVVEGCPSGAIGIQERRRE